VPELQRAAWCGVGPVEGGLRWHRSRIVQRVLDMGQNSWKQRHAVITLVDRFVSCPKSATMKPPSKRPPSNLWSSPTTSTGDVEQLKAALTGLKLTATQIAERRKAAAERVQAFKTGVSFSTLASRTD